MAQLLARLAPPLMMLGGIPLTMTCINIYVEPLRKFMGDYFGISINPDDVSFIKFFTTSKGYQQFSLIFLVWVLLTQIFFVPLFAPLNKPNPRFGKFTSISITEIPNYVYILFMYLFLPVLIGKELYKRFYDVSNSDKESNLFRRLGFLLGFLTTSFFVEKITLVDVITIASIYFALTKTDGLAKIMDAMGIDVNQLSQSEDKKNLVEMVTLMIVSLFVLTFGRFAPGYSLINNKVRQLTGLDGATGLANYGIKFLMFFVLPFAIMLSLNKTVNDDIKTQNFDNLGWTIGILTSIIANGLLPDRIRPLNLVRTAASKIDTVVGSIGSKGSSGKGSLSKGSLGKMSLGKK